MRKAKKYLITLAVGFAMVGLIAWAKCLFTQTALVSIFHILCDAFFATGVVITAAGLLIFSSNEGTFDMIAYGVQSFADLFRKTSRKKYDTFYDYKQSRTNKKISFGFLLIVGLCFLSVSMVFLYFYRQYC